MKLLMCASCYDVVKFGKKDWRACECGKSEARYLEDGWHGEIRGNAISIGLNNRDLDMHLLSSSGHGGDVKAWIFDRWYHRIRVVHDG